MVFLRFSWSSIECGLNFERGSNSNQDSKPRPNNFGLKGRGQPGTVGRFQQHHALQRPSPKRLTAHLSAQHSPFLFSFSAKRVPSVSPISYPLLLSPHDPRRRSNRADQARRRSSQASARDGARPGSPVGTHAKVRRARDGRRTGKKVKGNFAPPASIRGASGATLERHLPPLGGGAKGTVEISPPSSPLRGFKRGKAGGVWRQDQPHPSWGFRFHIEAACQG
jgi:hypothetical protein